MNRRHVDIPSLDGLRAISIMLVYAGHTGLDGIVPGGLGVTIFFVLSGYLITTLLRLELERSGQVGMRAFYVRRACRILPLAYLVLTVTALGNLLGVLGTGSVELWPTLSQYLHLGNYYVIAGAGSMMQGTVVYWSLAVEEHFYFLLPAAFVLMNRARWSFRTQATALLVTSAAVLAWRCALVYGMHVSPDRTFYATDTRLDALLIGCAAALVANPVTSDRADVGRTRQLAAIGVVALLGSVVVRDASFLETFRYSIQALGVLSVVRYVVLEPASWVGRLLNSRPLVWLGGISYAFYLVHFVILLDIEDHLGGNQLAAGVVSLPVCSAVAFALHRMVDPMSARMKRRWSQPAAPAPALGTTTA